jgi:hypothetical protein
VIERPGPEPVSGPARSVGLVAGGNESRGGCPALMRVEHELRARIELPYAGEGAIVAVNTLVPRGCQDADLFESMIRRQRPTTEKGSSRRLGFRYLTFSEAHGSKALRVVPQCGRIQGSSSPPGSPDTGAHVRLVA